MHYFLPTGYVSRSEPQHFDDTTTAEEWQPGAYALALDLAIKRAAGGGIKDVVDLGCGAARKLRAFRDAGLRVYGFDVAATVDKLRASGADWLELSAVDLDSRSGVSALAAAIPSGALVICCDVVEHLRSPGHLLAELATLHEFGSPIVLSTPDRDLAGCAPMGPPINPAHVREWTLPELRALCAFYGLEGGAWSHTQTVDTSDACSTITAVFA